MKRALVALVALAAVVLAVVLLGGGGGSTPTKKASAPEPLPDVTLQPLTSGGKAVDLGTLQGPAVVNLWANWCAPCKAEMPIYEQFHRANPDVPVIGVNTLDTQRGKALAVARAAGVTYPLVVDPDQAIRAVGLPRVLLVGADGKVVWSEYVEIKSLGQLEGLVKKHLG